MLALYLSAYIFHSVITKMFWDLLVYKPWILELFFILAKWKKPLSSFPEKDDWHPQNQSSRCVQCLGRGSVTLGNHFHKLMRVQCWVVFGFKLATLSEWERNLIFFFAKISLILWNFKTNMKPLFLCSKEQNSELLSVQKDITLVFDTNTY